MTWQAVAHKDFQDAIRSRWLWGLSVLFVGLIGGVPALLYGYYAPPEAAASNLFGAAASMPLLGLSLSYSGVLAFVIAFIALVTSHGSVIDERESGTLKLLLSLPHSRLDVVTGKFLGRSAVVALPVLAGFLVAVVALVATSTSVDFSTFLPQAVLTVLVAAAFVSLGLGVSASARSNREATVGIFGLYFLLAFLWSLVARGFPALLDAVLRRLPGVGGMATATIMELRMAVKFLNPLRAYETLVALLYAEDTAVGRFLALTTKAGRNEQLTLAREFCPEGLAQSGGGLCANGLAPVYPFYFSEWFVFLVLLAWIAVPAALGYLAFRDADL